MQFRIPLKVWYVLTDNEDMYFTDGYVLWRLYNCFKCKYNHSESVIDFL